jgi:hypothetical protein
MVDIKAILAATAAALQEYEVHMNTLYASQRYNDVWAFSRVPRCSSSIRQECLRRRDHLEPCKTAQVTYRRPTPVLGCLGATWPSTLNCEFMWTCKLA